MAKLPLHFLQDEQSHTELEFSGETEPVGGMFPSLATSLHLSLINQLIYMSRERERHSFLGAGSAITRAGRSDGHKRSCGLCTKCW